MEKQYNDWLIIDETPTIKKGKKYYNCRCKCGLEKLVQIAAMKNETSKRCSSCAGKLINLPKGFTNRWNGKLIGDLNATMFSHIKSKATERNLEFRITQKYISDLFEKQNKKCALSGLDIKLSTKIKNGNSDFNFITASLDRINSKIGYIEGNVQWVHKDVNKMKMAYDNQYFINICKLISKNNGNTEPS